MCLNICKKTICMDYAKESLRLHGEWKGKLEVISKVKVENYGPLYKK